MAEKNSEHGFFEFRLKLIIGQKKQEYNKIRYIYIKNNNYI